MLKEGGGPLCSLDCDPSSRSLSLKVSAQGTNEPLGRERSIPCCPGVMAVPGFSPLFYIFILFIVYIFRMILTNLNDQLMMVMFLRQPLGLPGSPINIV